MRKFTLLGLTALALAAMSFEPASAWINFKFGVGLNWNWQSGGNNTLWGLFRNGQPPGNGQPFDPSICPTTGCFNTGQGQGQSGGCGGGCGNPYGGYGGYGTGMLQPGYGPQMPGAPQPCMTQPNPAGQQNCPSFPGFHPYQNNEFQYFGGQPPMPNNTAGDLNRQNAMAAQGAPPQYQYQAAYPPPWNGASYYPGYPQADPYFYNNSYQSYQSFYSPYGR